MKTPRVIEEHFEEPSSERFTDDAIVHDEARDHHGRQEIAAWMKETQRRYQFVNQLLHCAPEGSNWLATARITGNFPGSPIELRYRFTLEGALIAKLAIA